MEWSLFNPRKLALDHEIKITVTTRRIRLEIFSITDTMVASADFDFQNLGKFRSRMVKAGPIKVTYADDTDSAVIMYGVETLRMPAEIFEMAIRSKPQTEGAAERAEARFDFDF